MKGLCMFPWHTCSRSGGLVGGQRFLLLLLPMSVCSCSFSRDARRSVCVHLFLHPSPLMNSPPTPPPTSPRWDSDDIRCFRGLFVLLMQCFPTPGADVGDGKEYCHISPPPPRQMERWDSNAIVAALLGHLIFF